MSKKIILISFSILLLPFFSCKNKNTKSEKANVEQGCSTTCANTSTCSNSCGGSSCPSMAKLEESADLQIVYFHATHRCATCNAVEKETLAALEASFGSELPFASLNREKEENKALVDKYKISGQTLLIISGDSLINYTNTAFMLARTNPKKYKEKLVTVLTTLQAKIPE